jgi:hypothetical protein
MEPDLSAGNAPLLMFQRWQNEGRTTGSQSNQHDGEEKRSLVESGCASGRIVHRGDPTGLRVLL